MAKEDINTEDNNEVGEAGETPSAGVSKKIQVTHDDENTPGTPKTAEKEEISEVNQEDTVTEEIEERLEEDTGQSVDTDKEVDSSEPENVEKTLDSDNSDSEVQEKTAGPDGPYRPELTKTIEEVINEANAESVENSEIDEAVDDIVRSESDEVIASEDEKLAGISATPGTKKSFKQQLKDLAVAWWQNKKARYGTFAGLFVLLVFLILFPFTRYSMLNAFGVRVSSNMTIIDSQTRLPLKNISVSLQDKQARSDEDGNVFFSDLKLGSSDLSIVKIGYADNNKKIILGWGSNPIGDQELIATGEQFTFVLSDWKSGEPVTDAEAVAGENSASSDDSGKIVLTVGEENISSVEVQIMSDGYRTESLASDQLVEEDIEIKMVPGKKHVFVSNRNGEYDLYKIDVDGQNEEVLLGSTGKEREVPTVLQHPTRDITAFVSSRDGEENTDGFVLDGLFIIDVNTGDTNRITRSEQLQLIGWSGDNLVFWQVIEGTSRGNPQRSKLVSYNERTGERIEIATANYFNDVELVNNIIYYAISSFAVPQSQAKLYSKNIDGTMEEKVLDLQVWNIFRTGHEILLFSTESQKWYEKNGSDAAKEVGQQPIPSSRKFVDSPSGDVTAWVEVRDGKGVLLSSSTGEFEEQQELSLPGLSEVLYWSNDTSLVFRVISNSETADYILNLDGGEQQKISDVTATRNTYF
jgi:hypothetical protein